MREHDVAGIHVREWGDESGRPILFWPGLSPWGSLQLVEVGPLLAGRGFRVLAIAAPGAGESPILEDPDRYRPTQLAALALEVATAFGVDRFVYMGHSWGASIGVHLAARSPERLDGLVLLDAGHTDVAEDTSREQLVHEYEADQAQFSFESWDAYLGWVKERVRAWRPALEPRYRAGMAERDGRIVPLASARAAAWARHGVASERPSSAHGTLAAGGVPVLLIVASDNDDSEALARFEAAVPDATINIVESGHDIPEDAPEQTVALVTDWLERAG